VEPRDPALKPRVLIIGNPQPTHVGGHLIAGGQGRSIETALLDINLAYHGPRLLRSLAWRCFGRRPLRLRSFGVRALELARQWKPEVIISVGLAPLSAPVLQGLKQTGARVMNFLTDDPWNPQHRAPWFMRALSHYDTVFTPRRANVEQLRAIHGPTVEYLPFAYSPAHHYPPENHAPREASPSGVLFIGGADAERVQIMRGLIEAGLPLSLWGGYWQRQSGLETYSHGHADSATMRGLVASAAANLCLVRAANRDGHSMRSYELAAIGGPMLVEFTTEHVEIFGNNDECVRYFASPEQLHHEARNLIADRESQHRLANAVRSRICTQGRNTYGDRLDTMIQRVRAHLGDADLTSQSPSPRLGLT
jgi:spore maturation protein CgeB